MAIKINSFSAKGVYGYMNFDFEFKSNPTILTGPNGSGKTTALRIMQALLTPSLKDLLLINFIEASIDVSDASKSIFIAARKNKERLLVITSLASVPLDVPLSFMREFESEYVDIRRPTDSARLLRVKYSDNPTFKAISELESPLFLGLDRRNSGFQENYAISIDSGDMAGRDYIGSRHRAIKGSLGAGLTEVQALVRDAFRRVRRLKDQQSERLRKKLLLTGFKYEEVSALNSWKSDIIGRNALSIKNLMQQRKEILSALEAVGIDESDAKKEIAPFFDRVLKLASKIHSIDGNYLSNDDAVLEVLLNQASIRRLHELVETVRDFNSKSAGLLLRFQLFVRCVNRFYADSRKKIDIDPVGVIKVFRPDGTEVPLEALSSGERQLLVMFGHVFFSSFGNRSNAFIIDEPEISLHLRWQEILLQEMMDSSSRAQIIVATHSPEIVGDMIDNCVSL